jgi:hypothetical protein
MSETADLLAAFAPMEAGPGTAFAKRLRLVHPKLGAYPIRTAAILVALIWLPLFVLSWTVVPPGVIVTTVLKLITVAA